VHTCMHKCTHTCTHTHKHTSQHEMKQSQVTHYSATHSKQKSVTNPYSLLSSLSICTYVCLLVTVYCSSDTLVVTAKINSKADNNCKAYGTGKFSCNSSGTICLGSNINISSIILIFERMILVIFSSFTFFQGIRLYMEETGRQLRFSAF